MRGILRVMTLPAILCVLCITVAFGAYACVHHRRGAVPEALLASLMAAEPYTLCFNTPDANPDCRALFAYVRQNAAVCFVADSSQSRYDPYRDLVCLTKPALEGLTADAVHEYGHAADRYLGSRDGVCCYYSHGEPFRRAYELDSTAVRHALTPNDVFKTSACRNPAVSDILFTLFYADNQTCDALLASYRCAGFTFWRHDSDYLADAGNRLTEVFANIFVILLSDDEPAKAFLYTYLPQSTGAALCAARQAAAPADP